MTGEGTGCRREVSVPGHSKRARLTTACSWSANDVHPPHRYREEAGELWKMCAWTDGGASLQCVRYLMGMIGLDDSHLSMVNCFKSGRELGGPAREKCRSSVPAGFYLGVIDGKQKEVS